MASAAESVVMNGTRYLIRGDNLLAADGYIAPSYILGRVTQVQRTGKKPFTYS